MKLPVYCFPTFDEEISYEALQELQKQRKPVYNGSEVEAALTELERLFNEGADSDESN